MPDFIVDAVLVLVIFFGAVLGYKRGFIGFVAKPLKFVLSLGLSFGCAGRFASSTVTPIIEAPATNYVLPGHYCAERKRGASYDA